MDYSNIIKKLNNNKKYCCLFFCELLFSLNIENDIFDFIYNVEISDECFEIIKSKIKNCSKYKYYNILFNQLNFTYNIQRYEKIIDKEEKFCIGIIIDRHSSSCNQTCGKKVTNSTFYCGYHKSQSISI
jgi:hypothetical protein